MSRSIVPPPDASRAWERELFLHYQPIVHLDTHAVHSVEALARIERDGRVLAPNLWVPLAEQSGQIDSFGSVILHRAVADLQRFITSQSRLNLAVNVSPLQLTRNRLLPTIRTLADAGFPLERLCLELTESAMVGDGAALAALGTLRSLGCRIALDDFGAGHSSLVALARLPIDVVKLDQSIVRLADRAKGQAILDSIVQMCQRLRVEVIAEGIETDFQLARVKASGVTLGQGYLLGRPSPIADIELGRAAVAGKHRGAVAARAATPLGRDLSRPSGRAELKRPERARLSRVPRNAAREVLVRQLAPAQHREMLGELTGGIAHDLNNFLGVILNCAAFAREELADGPGATGATSDWSSARSYIAQIQSSADRAAALVRRLHGLTRGEAPAWADVNLNQSVTGLEDLLRCAIGKQVDVTTVLSPGLWSVRADPTDIDRVLLNLAVNARDAMPDGGTLTIETENVILDDRVAEKSGVRPGRHVRLRVADSGVGMTPDVLEQALDPFFTTKPEGSGLGLATVNTIIAECGGVAELHPGAESGLTFVALLPASGGNVASSFD